jgi:crossover junction endodeoxyribonuclease RusA
MHTEIKLLGRPISTQNAYGQVKNRRYMKKAAKEMKASYIEQTQKQYGWELMEWPLEIFIKLYFNSRARRDRDNRHKISMDSLEWIVFKDDSQIQIAHVEKFYDKENPRIELVIKSIEQ